MMTDEIKDWVKKNREEQAKRFGEIGLKTDCRYCQQNAKGEMECAILIPKRYDPVRLNCECQVCHFYKERGTE